MIKYVVVCGS